MQSEPAQIPAGAPCPGGSCKASWGEQSVLWVRTLSKVGAFCFPVAPWPCFVSIWELLPLHFLSQFSFQPNHKEILLSQSFLFSPLPHFVFHVPFCFKCQKPIRYLFFLFQNFLFPGCGHSVSLCSSFQGKNLPLSWWILAGGWIWVTVLPSQGGWARELCATQLGLFSVPWQSWKIPTASVRGNSKLE